MDVCRACDSGKADAAKVLVDANADVDKVNRRGETALHWACTFGMFTLGMFDPAALALQRVRQRLHVRAQVRAQPYGTRLIDCRLSTSTMGPVGAELPRPAAAAAVQLAASIPPRCSSWLAACACFWHHS